MIPAKYWSPTKKLMLLGAMAGGKTVEDTATGNPLTFQTDLARPLRSLLIPFTPVQSGTGDPSPQNIRPIVPWDGLKVFGSGQNIVTNNFTNGVLDLNTGAKTANPNYIISDYIPVVPLKSYYFKCPTVVSSELDICYYDKDKHYIGYADADGYVSCNVPGRSRKTPAGCYYVRIDTRNAQYNNDICINYPASVTGYVPAVGITETDISFASPVYGGTLDVVTGVLTVTHELWTKNTATMDNSVNYPGWKESGIKSLVGAGLNTTFRNQKLNVGSLFAVNTNGVNDVLFLPKEYGYGLTQDEWIALAIDVQIAVPLATPHEITLTPEQITALLGNNTIWSDADGSMTAVYFKKG